MILGMSHKQQVGKDTVGEMLCRNHGFRRLAFADKLKDFAYDIDPMILANATVNVNIGSGRLAHAVNRQGWDAAKKQFKEIRPFLQRLGVAVRKHFGEDTWVRVVLDQVTDGEDVVITDVRFPNEADAIKARGGFVVRIDRPYRPDLPVGEDHISEKALDGYDFDYTLSNYGSLGDLDGAVEKMLATLKVAGPVEV